MLDSSGFRLLDARRNTTTTKSKRDGVFFKNSNRPQQGEGGVRMKYKNFNDFSPSKFIFSTLFYKNLNWALSGERQMKIPNDLNLCIWCQIFSFFAFQMQLYDGEIYIWCRFLRNTKRDSTRGEGGSKFKALKIYVLGDELYVFSFSKFILFSTVFS